MVEFKRNDTKFTSLNNGFLEFTNLSDKNYLSKIRLKVASEVVYEGFVSDKISVTKLGLEGKIINLYVFNNDLWFYAETFVIKEQEQISEKYINSKVDDFYKIMMGVL